MAYIFNRSRVFWLHFSFWCVYLSFFLYQVSGYQQGQVNWTRVFLFTAVSLSFNSLIAYINYFYFLPRFLAHKNVVRYLLEFLVPFAVLITIRIFLERSIADVYAINPAGFYTTRFVVHVVAISLFITIFVGMIRFAVDWFEFEAKKKAVENEKLTAELNFLKAQVNPHFLFNTLNNLYYLAYTQSPNTTEVIAKLSQMMRYMIYDSNHPQVLMTKEIEYIENYISLETLRLNNEIPIRFEINGNPDGITIVPLIFITFLENAFKHGVSSNQPDSWVYVLLDINGNECTYTVENSKLAQPTTSAEGKSGIGLQNVQRRLELSYPGQYDLKVENTPERYAVQLKLTLANHELSHHRRRAVGA
jgi:two-component system, LytTR family, sensor histidine kinase AlgZ